MTSRRGFLKLAIALPVTTLPVVPKPIVVNKLMMGNLLVGLTSTSPYGINCHKTDGVILFHELQVWCHSGFNQAVSRVHRPGQNKRPLIVNPLQA